MSERTTGRTLTLLTGEVVAATLLTWTTSLLLLTFGRRSPALGPYAALLATAPMIYLPLILMLYWQEPAARYGLSCAHAGRALTLVMLAIITTFPPYALGLHTVRHGLLPANAPPGVASPFTGFTWLLQVPQSWPWPLQAFLRELFFVALPEEFFYRGYVQGRLNALFAGRCRLLRTPVGGSLPASAALFALHHWLVSPVPERLLVFFPALLFGWLREAGRSLIAPALFHAACNLLAILLNGVPPASSELR